MLSVNQLQSSDYGQNIQNLNRSNNRGLFKRCKAIIQQQMAQINSLTAENEKLLQKLQKKDIQVKMTQKQIDQLKRNNQELQLKNQLLHKQLNSVNQKIESMTKVTQSKEIEKQLIRNKLEITEKKLDNYSAQNQQLKTKCALLEQTIHLLDSQNHHLQGVIYQKDQEMKAQVEQIRQLNKILKRKHNLQNLEVEHPYPFDRQSRLSYKKLSSQKGFCYPYETVTEPFHSIEIPNHSKQYGKSTRLKTKMNHSTELKRQRKIPQQHHLKPFNMDTINNSPISRIRKNGSKMKRSPENFQKLSNISQKYRNPEMQEELSNIKKEIISQYNTIQTKKEVMNHRKINNTLLQIQQKLHRLAKVSADDSQSQVE